MLIRIKIANFLEVETLNFLVPNPVIFSIWPISYYFFKKFWAYKPIALIPISCPTDAFQ